MPSIKVSKAARLDFQRLADGIRHFISADAALTFTTLVTETIESLGVAPPKGNYSLLGKEFHEARIKANKKRQYQLLYEYSAEYDEITILAIKDAREESFIGFSPIWTLGEKK